MVQRIDTTDASPEIVERVRECVARVTRYPLEVLTPEASLEDDLGIDSVKLAEIAAVLGRELNLTAQAAPRGEDAATIRGIARFVEGLLRSSAAAAAPAPVAPAPAALRAPAAAVVALAPVEPIRAAPAVTAAAAAAVAERVRAVIAQVTRYPLEVLTLQADIEDELGIDSVKQAEIAAVLAKELDLPLSALRPGEAKTIGAVVDAVAAALVAAPAPAANTAPAPANVAAQPAAAAPAAARRDSAPAAAPRALPFEGKIALVTGSGRGLGRAIAEHLAQLGATVVVNSFHSRAAGDEVARGIVARGGRALHAWGSVAQPDHLAAIFSRIEGELGGLDFLVCNASDGYIGPFDRIEPKHWDRAFRTNITGAYECAMRAAPLMRARGGGSIVTMSTITSQRYLKDFGCQGVVKAAVESLTRYLACELAEAGVRANCIAAGPVYGELINKFPDAQSLIARWESMSPGGALTTPEDVASMTEFLLGPGARAITGATFCVDNGASGQVDGRIRPLQASSQSAPVRALAAV